MKKKVLSYDKHASYPISIMFCGDIMPPYLKLKNDPFEYLDEYLNQADIVVANLEAPLAGEQSGFPNFSFGDDFVNHLKRFDLLFTANNHAGDAGAEGVQRTIEVLKKAGIKHAGTVAGQKESKSVTIAKQQLTVEFFSYVTSVGKPIPKDGWSINMFDAEQVKADLNHSEADVKVLYVHTREEAPEDRGNEYSVDAKKTWKLSPFEELADIIVNAHPHRFQGAVRSMKKVHGFSLGNLLSDQNKLKDKDSGCLMRVSLDGTENRATFLPVCSFLNGDEYHILPLKNVQIGKYDFITSEQRETLNQAYTQIKSTLSERGLTEI
jgi:poly-gamma-glutamate capsule biosynthesis protein CapA/YwtB (metallophosphatase superfamily)